ncbi:MAG: right-handed parallel beta-helix repeat-containing protein [Lachnospiraceae bacterium]|nr:right-handed parallel beta-helix repeat-containing protein [Lachnospiraceae bacterium]
MNDITKYFHPQPVILLPVFILFILALLSPINVFAKTYYYNVTDYGADGSDRKDDTSAIQKLLDEATENDTIVIKFPAGTYYISRPLYIQSNTKLQLNSKATIRRSNHGLGHNMLRTSDASHVSTGYPGYTLAHNITITGGTWDGGDISKAKQTSNLIYIGHSSNVTISNATIKNCYGAHSVEFAGVKNGTVKNCNFYGFRYDSDRFTSEAIQIDVCYKDRSSGKWTPGFELDKTACTNILIENNTIKDYPRGIGAHHVLKGHYSTNITIRNNKIARSSSSTQGKCMTGILLMGTNKVSISKNTINHYYYGIMIKNSKKLSIKNNKLKYNTSGNLILESCDIKSRKRKFTVTKDTVGEQEFQYTCPGIKGYVKTDGETYHFGASSKEHTLELKNKIKRNQKITFYGKDTWGNTYYRIYYVS